MKKFNLLFPVVSLLCCMLAYGIAFHIAWNEAEELSRLVESVQKHLHVRESNLKVALISEPKPLGKKAVKHVKKIFHDVRKKCDVIPETHDCLRVVRRLIHNDNKGAQDAYLDVKRPVGHVTASKNHTNHTKKARVQQMVTYWRHQEAGKTFLCSGVNLTKNFLTVPKAGRYYIYSQVKFQYNRHKKRSLHRHSLHLSPWGSPINTTVLENNYYLGMEEQENERPDQGDNFGLKVSHHGAVVKLHKMDRLYVETNTGHHSQLVTDRDADTFFGMYMVS